MCDTVVRVGPDRVLFAKNSDRDPNEAQLLEWHPASDHAPGEQVRCTEIAIPQVERTAAVLLSRPFWMWGAEMGANEHGVVIGNEAVFTKQPYARTGLLGMDLLRLGLERSTTAASAVEVITALLEEHGQGGGCGHERRSFTYHNSFLVADATGAYVLETADRLWAVEEVTDGPRSISNGLTIAGFADEHADRLRGRVAACAARRASTEVHAAGADGPRDLAAAMRDHGDGAIGPRYSPVNGAMSAPCVHASGILAASQTTASWISELTPSGARHWATGTAAPCTSLYKPVDVLVPVATGPAPTDVDDGSSLWWRHERLHRRVLRDPDRLLPTFLDERDQLEARWFASPPPSATAFAEAADATERWLAQLPTDVTDRRPFQVRRYWRERERRAGSPAPAPDARSVS